MPPLEQTLLSSSNHSVGSGSSIFAKVRTNLALSPTRHTKPCISSKHNIHNNVTTSNVDSELRTARDACIGAMMALVHYLSQRHRISTGSCVHELHQTIPQSYYYQYHTILQKIIQQGVMKLPSPTRNDEYEIIHMLVLGCWQTQQRYAQLQYQKAHRHYHNLRFQNSTTGCSSQLPSPPKVVTTMSFVTATTSGTTETNLNQALHHQITMAEYQCTCQKEIILCQRSYERHQTHQQYQQLLLLQQQQQQQKQ